MQADVAISALSALAHEHRLAVFRLLVRAGDEGMAAGVLARELNVLPNTLSSHLASLGYAGLIRARRAGRSLIYTADYDRMGSLIAYLLEDCCAGRPEICAPLAEALSCATAR